MIDIIIGKCNRCRAVFQDREPAFCDSCYSALEDEISELQKKLEASEDEVRDLKEKLSGRDES